MFRQRKGPFDWWIETRPRAEKRVARRHDRAGPSGGRDADGPERRTGSPFPPPLPRVGLGHNCPPIHMFNILPERAGLRPPSPVPHGLRNTSAPGQIQAGVAAAAAAATRRLKLPQSAPSLATAAAPPVTRRDAGAEALRERKCLTFRPLRAGHAGTCSSLCAKLGWQFQR